MKTLVAYFSASGYTASLAKRVAQAADADLFEIKPLQPYTDADLKWTNPLARCNKEKIGKKDVPVAGRKKVALFATSGGSDISKAPGKLQPLMKGEIVGARLFRPDESFPVIKTWTSSLE